MAYQFPVNWLLMGGVLFAFSGAALLAIGRALLISELRRNCESAYRELDKPGFIGENFLIYGPMRLFRRLSKQARNYYALYLSGWLTVLVAIVMAVCFINLRAG